MLPNFTSCVLDSNYVRLKESAAPNDIDNVLTLRKEIGSNNLLLDDAVGSFTTLSSTGSSAYYSQLKINGDLKVKRSDDDETMFLIDTDAKETKTTRDLTINGNLNLSGVLTKTIGVATQFDDALLKLANGNTIFDIYNQGIYAQYSANAGVDVRYRGLMYAQNDSTFTFFDQANDASDNDPLSASLPFECKKLRLKSDTNQIELGFGFDKVLINATPAPGGSTRYTIHDAGANADLVMTEGNQTINGYKVFRQMSVARPIGGTLQDNQLVPFMAYANPTNLNSASGPILRNNIVTETGSGNAVLLMPTITFGNATAGVREFGTVEVRLKAGTHRIGFGYSRSNNKGQYEIYCTALSLSIAFDAYNATTESGTQLVSFVVPTAGIYSFALRQTGKNASSSSYIMDFYPHVNFTMIA